MATLGPLSTLRGGDALLLLSREAAGEDRLGDQRQGTPRSQRRDHGPLAGAFLAGGVEDQVDQRLAGLGVLEAEDVASDLDQVAVQRALVPLARRRRAWRPVSMPEQRPASDGRPRR